VRVLAEAIGQCIAKGSNHADIKLHDGKTQARLELGSDGDELPTAWLKLGKRKLPFHRSTLALVHPIEEIRGRLIVEFEGKGSIGEPFTMDFLGELVREQNVEIRVDLFHQCLAADFARRKEMMSESLSRSGTIQVTDLELPPVGTMLNYLGLPADFSGSLNDLVRMSQDALVNAIGIERAMYRLSSLPIDLPDGEVSQLVKGMVASENSWPREDSVLAAGFCLSALAKSGAAWSDADGDWVGRSITSDRARLFVTFVRYGARQALEKDDWRHLSPEVAICLIWLHADQLVREFGSSNVDIPAFTKWLVARSHVRLFDFEREVIWPSWAIEITLQLTAPLLIAKVVARLLSEGLRIPDQLRDLVGREMGGRWTPQPEVLEPTPVDAPDQFWAARDPILPMVAAGWLADDHPFSERHPEKLILRIFEDTKDTDPTFFASLISLLVDINSVQTDHLDAIQERLELALAAPGATGEPSYSMITDLMARIYARKGDAVGFAGWLRKETFAGSEIRPQRRLSLGDENEASRVLAALLNTVYVFARCGDRALTERIKFITTHFKEIVRLWPTSLLPVISCLDRISQELSVEVSRHDLLPTLLDLRAL